MIFAARLLHGRGLAHSFERRSNSSQASSASAMTGTAGATQTRPVKSVTALASFVTFFGVVIIVFVVWRIGVWRRRKRLAAATSRDMKKDINDSKGSLNADVEVGHTPENVLVVPTPLSVWVPQLSKFRPVEITVPPTAAAKTSRSKHLLENIAKLSAEGSPPPAYFGAKDTTERYTPASPTPTTPEEPEDQPATIPVPPIPLPPIPSTHGKFMSPTISPAISPRSSSFSRKSLCPSFRSTSKGKGNKRLPRLMTITDTFVPSLEDELSVKLGEVVRLLEEYDDKWCLVQRVGRPDAPQGVVPRFCLKERPEIVPALGHRVSYVKTPSHSRLPIQGHDRTRSSSVVSVADLLIRPQPVPKPF